MKLSTYFAALPTAAVAIVVAVANRRDVVFSLDPFSQNSPAVAVQMPLFVLLFLAVLAGVLLAWLGIALGRARRLLPSRPRKSRTPPG
jgi:uncharacterized integral membrane protein